MLPNLISGGTAPSGNCNPNELTIRHSFKKVVDSDYEPLDWDGRSSSLRRVRDGARSYAATTVSSTRLARLHLPLQHLGAQPHYTDATAMTGATKCKVDDDCGAIASSRACRTAISTREVHASFKDRTQKPIVCTTRTQPEMYFDRPRAAEEWTPRCAERSPRRSTPSASASPRLDAGGHHRQLRRGGGTLYS